MNLHPDELRELDELAAMEQERDALRAEVERLRAIVARVRELARNIEREQPKPGPGGFIAQAILEALDGES